MTSSTRSIRARSSMRNSLGPSQRPDPGRRPTPIPAWSPVPRAARHDDRSIRGEFRIFARTAQSGIRRLGPGSSARSMLPRSVTLTQWHGVSPSGSTIRATASVAATPTAGAGELRWAGPSSGGFRPGRSGFTTRTMPWPPGSKVATKGHRPGSADPRSWSERHRASRGNANDRPPSFAVVQPPGMTDGPGATLLAGLADDVARRLGLTFRRSGNKPEPPRGSSASAGNDVAGPTLGEAARVVLAALGAPSVVAAARCVLHTPMAVNGQPTQKGLAGGGRCRGQGRLHSLSRLQSSARPSISARLSRRRCVAPAAGWAGKRTAGRDRDAVDRKLGTSSRATSAAIPPRHVLPPLVGTAPGALSINGLRHNQGRP